jgi:hypothetical protein
MPRPKRGPGEAQYDFAAMVAEVYHSAALRSEIDPLEEEWSGAPNEEIDMDQFHWPTERVQ